MKTNIRITQDFFFYRMANGLYILVHHWQKESNDRKRGGRFLSSGRPPKNCCFFVLAEGLGQVKTDSWMPLRSINVKLSLSLAICFQHLTIRVNPNRYISSFNLDHLKKGVYEACENSVDNSVKIHNCENCKICKTSKQLSTIYCH